jgi:peptidyl-Asp metalloendopeptidase
MVRFLRSRLRWILPLTLCAGSMVGSTFATVPAPRPNVVALESPRRATDSDLPRQARAGTGILGRLSPGALAAATLAFELPDGRLLHAQRQQRVVEQPAGYNAWVGTFEEQPGSLAVLGTYGGVTTGFLSYGAELWEILPAGADGQLVLYRFDDSLMPTVEPVVSRKPDESAKHPTDYGTNGATPEMLAAGYVHDLLVVYTPATRERYGVGVLESLVHNAVQAANQAYRNSGVVITLELVGLQEVDYVETNNMKKVLTDLQKRGDGQLDAVHAMRDRVGADIVTLLAEASDSCGIAWSMRGEHVTAAKTAFNVVNAGCLSNQSLAHEVGHNQGNMHDRDSTTNTGAFPYSYGYRQCTGDGAGFRTIMSYACKGVARVARFSSPQLLYRGQAMGVAYETNPEHAADNVRSMNNAADTVAAFRTLPGLTQATAPERLSAWTSAPQTVVLHWFDAADNEMGYKVERSVNGIEFEQIAMLGANATHYVDQDVGNASRYYYRVRAFNGRGNTRYTETREVGMW